MKNEQELKELNETEMELCNGGFTAPFEGFGLVPAGTTDRKLASPGAGLK